MYDAWKLSTPPEYDYLAHGDRPEAVLEDDDEARAELERDEPVHVRYTPRFAEGREDDIAF